MRFVVATIEPRTGNTVAITRTPMTFDEACKERTRLVEFDASWEYSVKEYKE